MVFLLLTAFLPFAVPAGAAGIDDFVITVKTDNTGTSSNTQFTIPTTGGGYDYNVDCNNDGTDEVTGQTGNYTCTYGATGTYTIRISDNSGAGTGFPRVYFNAGGDRRKLLTVEQWGTGHWTSMMNAFNGCSNLTVPATDAPDLSGLSDMSAMFQDQDSFNQPIGSWNTANVTTTKGMFWGATLFNQDIGGWDTANITDMSSMLYHADAFKQDIGAWNTSNVTDMNSMFSRAAAFDQDIGGWDTANVTDMGSMFERATAFDQDIGSWDIRPLTLAYSMFSQITLSTANYDSLLMGWGAQALQPNVGFDGGNSTYCLGESARNDMIGADGWTITDGGKDCSTVRVWDGGGMNNNWSTAANWVGDVVPLPTDSVAFDGTSSKDAVLDAAFGATVGSIFISDQYAGRLSFAAALAVAGYLNEAGGSVTLDPAFSFTVDGSFYHSGGILQQVRPVNVADVNFLENRQQQRQQGQASWSGDRYHDQRLQPWRHDRRHQGGGH